MADDQTETDPAVTLLRLVRTGPIEQALDVTLDRHWLALEIQRRCGAIAFTAAQRQRWESLCKVRDRRERPNPWEAEVQALVRDRSCAECVGSGRCPFVSAARSMH